MAIERFINSFQTTLSSGINDSTASIPVNLAAPVANQFRAIIESEIIIITANGDTTTWTATRGAEGTSNVSHSLGATVTIIQTKGSFEQMIADQCRFGTYASKPSDSDGLLGQRYIITDEGYDFLLHNGSSWDHYKNGIKVTVPPTSGWTAINSASVAVSNGMRILSLPSSGSDNARGEVRTLSGDLTFIARFYQLSRNTNFSQVGVWLRESGTGKFVTYNLRNDGLAQGVKWDNLTTINSAYTATDNFVLDISVAFAFKVVFGPTNRVITVLHDGIQKELHTVAKEDFATTAFDQYGWFANTSNSEDVELELYSLEIN